MYAIDTETHLITQENPAPKVVCVTTTSTGSVADIHTPPWTEEIIPTSDVIVGHNLAFDMYGVGRHEWGRVLQAYRDGRVWDTMLWEQLRAIACGTFDALRSRKGSFSLAKLVSERVGVSMRKDESTYRLRYSELDGVPLSGWPKEAVEYAQHDAMCTWALGVSQRETCTFPDMVLQCRAALALQAVSARGLAIDRERADVFSKRTIACRDSLKNTAPFFRATGKTVSKCLSDLRAHILDRLGDSAPRTATGLVATDSETLKLCGTRETEHLLQLAEVEKLAGTYVPILQTDRVHPRYHTLVATGRTSSYGPNVQNLPRAEGVRECFTAAPGYVLCSIDYDSAEMRALAQICVHHGYGTTLAEALNSGTDPHLWVAARMLRIPYVEAESRLESGDKVVKNARQFAKIANFGFAGGMGASAFVDYAKGYGITVDEYSAKGIREAWLAAWPEMRAYFADIGRDVDEYGCLTQYRSGRVRGGLTFTSGCNTLFQGLVADAAKDALWALWSSTVDNGALSGCHVVAFLHDEFLLEVPEDSAHEVAFLARDIVVERAQRWMPDVNVTASPTLMRHWSKAATETYSGSRLIPWEDKC